MATKPSIKTLPNLGPKSLEWLHDAGITTLSELKTLGPVTAYRLVQQKQPKATLNLLWALAAALENIDWRQLPDPTKQKLKKELEEDGYE